MKENCRKLLVVLLALALLMSLCACAAPAPAETSSVESGPSGQSASEPDPAPDPAPQTVEDGGPEDAGSAEEQDLAGGEDADEEDPDNTNTELGVPPPGWVPPPGSGREPEFDFTPLVEEICSQLYLYDEALTGLTPVPWGYGINPDETLLDTGCHFENDKGEEVAWRFVICSITPEGNETYSLTLLDFVEWDGVPIPYSLFDVWDGESLPHPLP